jgi:hypothetical protein
MHLGDLLCPFLSWVFRSFPFSPKFQKGLLKAGLLLFLPKMVFCPTCASYGYFELSKWAYSQNCPLYGETISVAAGFPEPRALPFMKWARSEGAKIFRMAYQEAAREGHMGTIKWLVEERGWNSGVVEGAAEGGRREVLLWGKEEGYIMPSGVDPDLLAPCTKNGDIGFLEFLKQEGFQFSVTFVINACLQGHVPILSWLIYQNHRIRSEFSLNMSSFQLAVKLAIQGGHLAVLKWLQKNFTFTMITSEEEMCSDAAFYGHFEILMFLRSAGLNWDPITCQSAAEGGHLKILKWAREHGCLWDEATCAFAARRGDFKLLKWARKHGCPWDEDTCTFAVRGGNLEILKWARELGCQWNSNTTRAAASKGYFEILKWAYEHGCPLSDDVCLYATKKGNFEMLKWARELGCPWNEYMCAVAAKNGDFEILKWLHEHGCPWDEATCSRAAESGNLEILQWVRERGCPWDSETCFLARGYGHWEVLQWVMDQGCPTGP